MYLAHQLFTTLHVVVGAVSLVVFWIPLAARKGSSFHVRSGRWFEWAMLSVSGSAFVLCILTLVDPVGVRFAAPDPSTDAYAYAARNGRYTAVFLLMLSLLVFNSVRHGMLAVRNRHDRGPLRRWTHVGPVAALLAIALPVGIVGLQRSIVLYMIFAVISVLGSTGILRYVYRDTVAPRQWLHEHFGGFIGAGIGAYTAFFAFGGRQFFGELLTGNWQIVPWLLPPIIGIIGGRWLERRYPAGEPAAHGRERAAQNV